MGDSGSEDPRSGDYGPRDRGPRRQDSCSGSEDIINIESFSTNVIALKSDPTIILKHDLVKMLGVQGPEA